MNRITKYLIIENLYNAENTIVLNIIIMLNKRINLMSNGSSLIQLAKSDFFIK